MYITNPSILNKTYGCNSKIAKYLIQNGANPIGEENGMTYFIHTDTIDSLLKKMPFWIRLF